METIENPSDPMEARLQNRCKTIGTNGFPVPRLDESIGGQMM